MMRTLVVSKPWPPEPTGRLGSLLFVLLAALAVSACTSFGPGGPAEVDMLESGGFRITEEARFGLGTRSDFREAMGLLEDERYEEGIDLLVALTEVARTQLPRKSTSASHMQRSTNSIRLRAVWSVRSRSTQSIRQRTTSWESSVADRGASRKLAPTTRLHSNSTLASILHCATWPSCVTCTCPTAIARSTTTNDMRLPCQKIKRSRCGLPIYAVG